MKRGPKHSHNDLSAAFVRSVFSYNRHTGILRWKIALSSKAHVGEIAGGPDAYGRWRIGIKGKRYFAHRIIWIWVTGKWPAYEIDHRDEVKSNNRWNNLRHATPSQNHRNRGAQKNNTTGYKGVCFDKANNAFVSGIKLHGKRYNLGYFKTAKKAHAAYCAAARELHGEEWMRFK